MFSQDQTEQKPIRLTFRDLIFMHNEGLILRCNTVDKAQQEKKEGGEGDFISLATFAIPGNDKEIYKSIIPKLMAYSSSSIQLYCEQVLDWDNMEECKTRYVLYSLLLLEKSLTPKLRKDLDAWQESLVQHMETSIYKHIKKGVAHCIQEGKKPALLLGKRHKAAAINPNNFTSYPLGKFGKHSFPPEFIDCLIEVEVLGNPTPPNLTSELHDQTAIEQYNAGIDAILRKFVPKLYEKLINDIKEKSSRFWNKQLQPSTQSQASFWNRTVIPSPYSGFQNYQRKKRGVISAPCFR